MKLNISLHITDQGDFQIYFLVPYLADFIKLFIEFWIIMILINLHQITNNCQNKRYMF